MDYTALPEFIPADATEIFNQWKDAYSAIIGRPLSPMQTETILCQVMAYREKNLRDDYNAGGRMMLIDFSKAPMLDYLVALLRVVRLQAQFAKTTIEFSIVTGHTGVTIPAGTRVQSTDGKATFATDSTKFIPTGTYIASISCTCTDAGVLGNDYAVGAISSILDPLPFLTSAANTDVSDGGADVESDEQLVSRAKDAPDSFSNAGSRGAYRFFAKSAHPSITDVAVIGPPTFPAGEVHLFPLVLGGGTTPTPILDAVLAACNADEVRPLCDAVFADSPTAVDFDIEVNLTTFDWAVDAEVLANVGQLLNDYAQGLKKKLALDAVIAEITKVAMQKEVYNAAVVSPIADVTLLENEYANVGSIVVNIIGHHA